MNICKKVSAFVVLTAITASQVFAGWTTPVPLSEINTQYSEGWPVLSSDGLTLYFARGGTPNHYYYQMYQATRTTLSSPFSNVSRIGELAYGGGHLNSAWMSPDNLRMYFLRTEPGSIWRLKVSTRSTTASLWGTPQNLTELNNLGDVSNAKLSSDELSIVFNVFQNEHIGFLYTASRKDRNSAFSNIRPLSELNTTDARAIFLSGDGLSLYFARNDNGAWHHYVSTRSSLAGIFGTAQQINYWPEHFGLGCFSADGKTAYLGYNGDIYASSYVPEPATLLLMGMGGFALLKRPKQ